MNYREVGDWVMRTTHPYYPAQTFSGQEYSFGQVAQRGTGAYWHIQLACPCMTLKGGPTAAWDVHECVPLSPEDLTLAHAIHQLTCTRRGR